MKDWIKHDPPDHLLAGRVESFIMDFRDISMYLNKKNMSLTDIGKLAGCTRINVHYIIKKNGIEARSKTNCFYYANLSYN